MSERVKVLDVGGFGVITSDHFKVGDVVEVTSRSGGFTSVRAHDGTIGTAYSWRFGPAPVAEATTADLRAALDVLGVPAALLEKADKIAALIAAGRTESTR